MTITAEKYVEQLLNISQKKHELLKGILSITREQTGVITEEGSEQLIKFIDMKQERIDAVDKLDDEFKSCFEGLKQEMKVKSLDELKSHSIRGIGELQQCISGIMQTVKEISLLEEENRDKANKLLGELGSEIKKLNQGKRMSSAYSSPSVPPSAYYFDTKK